MAELLISSLKNKVLDKNIEEIIKDFVKNLKLTMHEEDLDIPNPENLILSILNPDNPNNKEIIDNFVKQLAKANSIIVLEDEEFDEDLDEENRKYILGEYSKFEGKVFESLFKAFIKSDNDPFNLKGKKLCGNHLYFNTVYASSNFYIYSLCHDKELNNCSDILAKVYELQLKSWKRPQDIEKEIDFIKKASDLRISPRFIGAEICSYNNKDYYVLIMENYLTYWFNFRILLKIIIQKYNKN